MIILFCLAIVAAYGIQTIFGFAGTAIITPLLFLVIGADMTIAVTGMLGMIGCGLAAIKVRHYISFHEVMKILPPMIVGIFIGFGLKTHIIMDDLVKYYGVFVMLMSPFLFFTEAKMKFPPLVNTIILLLAGIIHGLFVCGGPLLILYAMQAIPEKNKLRSTINFIWVVLNGILVVEHFFAGLYQGQFFYYEGLAVLMAVLGIVLGENISKKIQQKSYIKLGSILLFLSGLLLLK